MPDWRDEVCGALGFWIARVGGGSQSERPVPIGRARQESQRGWYAVDIRGSRADTDQVESLRLCGKGGPAAGDAYQVMEAMREGSLIRLRVAEFVDINDAYLWQFKQPMTHLLEKLRDGIAGLADAGLAHDLAVGRLAVAPPVSHKIAGFTPMQQEAYASCLAVGVRLIWGPPGTGKTRVLAEAIGALIAGNKRVLLVSATNIAVDNALLGVVARRRHSAGELLRVGPPHHPDVLKYPDICLPYLVRAQLADVEAQRRTIETQLLELRDADDELARVEQAVAGFDPKVHTLVAQLLAIEESIPHLEAGVADCETAVQACRRDAEALRQEFATASSRVAEVAATRSAYAAIDQLQQQLQGEVAATDDQSARALTARHAVDLIDDELQRRQGGRGLVGLRDRGKIKQLRERLEEAEQHATQSEDRALDARQLLSRRRAAISAEAQQLSAAIVCTRVELEAVDEALDAARERHAAAQTAVRQAMESGEAAQQALLRARGMPRPTAHQRDFAQDADRRQLPQLALLAQTLRLTTAAGKADRVRLEKEHATVQDRFDRLRKDAEGEIIGRAKLIATTLARLRTSPALMKRPYDVVLIDEVGAANLPEILLAVSRATRAAVLLGDFMQLGAIIDKAVEKADRPDVQRWLATDAFAHCGISSPGDAQRHPGCTALDVQHRFGPEIMALANAIAYDGLLKAGPNVRAHNFDDPEIVVIDVDGLGEIAKVHPTGASSGWWPAGALLSRVLVDYHQARGERAGVVTPYGHQVDATLEALRDREAVAGYLTEVGTAHRFQGREFPIVIFDLVEDEFNKRWMAVASASTGTWEREGLRLFNVAVTRTQTRLYVIGSRRRLDAAPPASPLGHLAALIRSQRARSVPASQFLSPSSSATTTLGPFGRELAELLAEHVHVSEINDERSFYDVFADHLNSARRSLWIWAPWTASRVTSLLPVLADVVGRGVKVTLFVRDPSDNLQKEPGLQKYLDELRAIVPTVIEVNVMHQKIVVIDEKTVLLGSLNTLSQMWTREVMLTMHGEHFARKLLEHEHAEAFATPPLCDACKGRQLDLRRKGKADEWYWRCYARTCPKWSPTGRTNWTQRVTLRPRNAPRA